MTDLLQHPPAPLHKPPQPRDQPRRLSREETAQRDLGHTRISRPTAWLLVLAFLATIASLPLLEHLVTLRQWAAQHDSSAPVLPPIYDARHLLPPLDQLKRVGSWYDAYKLLPTPKQIQSFETQLEERSGLARFLIPRIQWLLTALGGTGNEQAIVGHDGWLFYEPAMTYVTGPPFLDEQRLAQIARFDDRSADPLPAIIQLHEQLAARGILLVLMPTPGKVQLHPERLVTAYHDFTDVLQNPSYDQFTSALKAAGVEIIDPGPLLARRKVSDGPQYLVSDTHWTPAAMEAVARATAQQLAPHLPAGDRTHYSRTRKTISNLGDIAVMLKLPAEQELFPPQQVTIAPVAVENQPWTPTAGAPVLLLGDSFCNIYSQPELAWGEAAGLAEQLSFNLGLPVDRIVINAGGAHATRQRLVSELARDTRRLDGVKVVIWQFAQRELLAGDWKPLPLPSPSERATPTRPVPAEAIRVRGTIRAIGRPPEPGTVPYRNCLVAIHLDHLELVKGQVEESQLLVLIHGMRDHRLTPSARWTVGQQVELTLLPWDQAGESVRSTQQRLTDTDADFTITSWWYAPPPKAPEPATGDPR